MGELIAQASNGVVAFVSAHMALAGPIVFLLGLGESIAGLSLLIPSTILFLAIGGVHSAAGGSFWPMWLWGAVGAFMGDVLSFLLGRVFRDDIGAVWPFRSRPQWYALARIACRRWGALAVLGSKFTAGLRPFIPVVAGAMRMPFVRFVPASALSCLVWAGVFLAPGYGLRFVFWA